ncbi:MAG: phosphatidylserine decarboxylase [Planctomycetes bacterium]|nr:phosphatidylserine decarboxylase [Planctomycetota bacterium]
MTHQFLARSDGRVHEEALFADRWIRLLYSRSREQLPFLLRAVTSRWSTRLLGWVNFDLPYGAKITGNRKFLERCGVDLSECLDDPSHFTTVRRVFERRIRYEECRPMPDDLGHVVSPADSKVVVGSLSESARLEIKGKFFDLQELLGDRPNWTERFREGDFGIFRLTPEKYHYNHAPVTGVVEDLYEVHGRYHSCNPSAVVEMVTPYSKNRRVVTVVQTDVPGGTGVGRVAMIEVVALLIGDIVQCSSDEAYDDPHDNPVGSMIRRGRPKSLFRPGSSTTVLLFEPGRIQFDDDLARNRIRVDVESRFSRGFGQPIVETDVAVREGIATRVAMEEAR